MMGDALLRSGHYRSADSCYHVMYEIDESFDSLRRLARQKELFGEFDEAIAFLDRAIAEAKDWASNTDLAGAHAELARMFYSRGFVDAALENIDSSLVLAPDNVSHLAMKADILRVKGLTTESDRIYRRLPTLSPNPYYKTALARVHLRRGDHAGADSLIKIAIDEYDRLSLKYASINATRYIEFLLDFGIGLDKALELAYARSRKRRDIYSYELLAWAYYKNAQYDLAWSAISLALRRQATDPRVVYRAAVIARAAGKDEKYRIFEKRSHALNPIAAKMYGG
jgi:tetratricopeptide (TPR) repeat protein